MAFTACIAEITKAAGRALTDDELETLADELARRQRDKLKVGGIGDMEQAITEAGAELARDLKTAAFIEKRNSALNAKARLMGLDQVRSQFGDNPARGLESVLVGSNRAVKGSRSSAAAGQVMLREMYGGGFIADLEKTGHMTLFSSGTLDREVSNALWALDTDEAALAKLPKEAVEIAKVVRKWQEVSRLDANKAGANIDKMPGYIVRQSHDIYRIRKAGYAAWRTDVLTRLDIEKTFGNVTPEELETALKNVYEGLASGVHLKARDQTPSGFKGSANLANKMSKERELHFKSANDWFDYNQKFGTGNLREAVMRGLETSAQNTALMRKLGPNPGANFDAMVDELSRTISDPEKRQKFTKASGPGGYLRQRMAVIDGSARVPVNQIGAKISAGARAGQGMAKLGLAVLSSVTDVPVYASEMSYQGHGFLSGMAEAVGSLFKGRNKKEMSDMDGLLGVFTDSMKQGVISRFSVAEDGLPGGVSKAQRIFYKLNLMQWWTDNLHTSAIRSMAHRAAQLSGKPLAEIGEDFSRVLNLYGIDAKRWDIIRSAVKGEADGRAYIVPEAIESVSDEAVRGIVPAGASPARIADAKRELADQYRTYLTDRGNIAVIEPDARVRAIMSRGTRPGTVEGEFVRFIGQFKSFTVAFTTNVLGRDLYGRGSNTLAEALRNGHGEMQALAQLILWTTLFGYAAGAGKDLARGKTPRDPLDPKTWAAAMAQGGGAGIFGDFLFGEMKNRFGGGFLSSLLGPTAGTVDDLADLIGRGKAQIGDPSSKQDVGSTAAKLAINHLPLINIFYTRMALDYLILYQIQENLNPGALRRMEQRVKKENGQTFLIPPSSVVH